MPARIAFRASSVAWAPLSCPPPRGSSRAAPPSRRVSAARASASSGDPGAFAMSRIGRQPIEVPAGVNVAISPGRVQINGPLGELSQTVPQRMKIEQDDGTLVVTRPTERGEDRALHGLTRSLVANMVEGVTKGFEKRLQL